MILFRRFVFIGKRPLGRLFVYMQWIYRLIVALVLFLVLRCLFREKTFWGQVVAGLVSIPLILRMLLIK